MITAMSIIGLVIALLLAVTPVQAAPSGSVDRVGRVSFDRAVDTLLHDPDATHRMRAADTLGKLEDERAIDPLIRALRQDPEKDVRAFAAVALGNIGAERALPALKYAVNNDPDFNVRRAALRAISRIEEEPIQPPPPAAGYAARPAVTRPLGGGVAGGYINGRRYGGVGSVIVTSGGYDYDRASRGLILGVPGRLGSRRRRLSLAERERIRQRLLYYYWPDGRPRKYYAGSSFTKPPIYPEPGGKAPRRLLRDPRPSRSRSTRRRAVERGRPRPRSDPRAATDRRSPARPLTGHRSTGSSPRRQGSVRRSRDAATRRSAIVPQRTKTGHARSRTSPSRRRTMAQWRRSVHGARQRRTTSRHRTIRRRSIRTRRHRSRGAHRSRGSRKSGRSSRGFSLRRRRFR